MGGWRFQNKGLPGKQICAEPRWFVEREMWTGNGATRSVALFSTDGSTAVETSFARSYKSLFVFYGKKEEEPQRVFTVDWLQRCCCAVTFQRRYIPFSQQMKHLQESVWGINWKAVWLWVSGISPLVWVRQLTLHEWNARKACKCLVDASPFVPVMLSQDEFIKDNHELVIVTMEENFCRNC